MSLTSSFFVDRLSYADDPMYSDNNDYSDVEESEAFDRNHLSFKVGMVFATTDMFKNIIVHYSILKMFKVIYIKSEQR